MSEPEFQIAYLVGILMQEGTDVTEIADALAAVAKRVEGFVAEVAEELEVQAAFDEIIEASFGGDDDEA